MLMRVSKQNKHTPAGVLATELFKQMLRANARLIVAGDRLTKDVHITSARWQVLATAQLNPSTAAQIGRELSLSRQSIQQAVNSLLGQELIRLVENPDHRRAKLIELTSAGVDTLKQVTKRQRPWANAIGANFTLAELKSAVQVMDKLRDVLA